MTGHAAAARFRRRVAAVASASLLALLGPGPLQAQTQTQTPKPAADTGKATATPAEAVQNSGLDAPLFYQLLIGEIELRSGHAANAFEVVFDAARRQGDEALFERAVQIALQAHSGDQALSAAQAWRKAKPRTLAPLRYHTQILLALNRPADAAEPLGAWLALAPASEKPALIANVPQLLQRVPDRQQALGLAQQLLNPYRAAPGTRLSARLALAQAQQAAGHPEEALALARTAHTDDPDSPGPALLALGLLPGTADAEALVQAYLGNPKAEPAVRLGYVRLLAQQQRYVEAVNQLEGLTAQRPELPEPWLTLGALRLDLKQLDTAESALLTYLKRQDESAAKPSPNDGSEDGDDDDKDEDRGSPASTQAEGRTQAWLLLAQVAEQRGDLKASEAWLAKVDNPQRALEVQVRRAALLQRQGKLKEARALIQSAPERTGDDARAKALAEAQLLRDAKDWKSAAEVLAAAVERQPEDTELIYEQAMVEEKLDRLPQMEALLRRVIALKPDHPHAHNALGYSLADRGQRLPEARELIRKALDLSPGDPFITDSLGWVEFRLGNRAEAIRLLQQAYGARPDTEIAAHLGEVLWANGQRDEARRIWREGRARDSANEVLRETLTRLKVKL